MNNPEIEKAIHSKSLLLERMKKTIIARKNEIESIKKHFDCVLRGDSGICVISGLPGIGKTFLVENAVKELSSNNITFIYGKFTQNDKKPFIAISEVIEQMVRHLLTLPNDELNNIKIALTKALGSDLGIITSINPYARKLFGHHKTINIDNYHKLKYRVKKALLRFLSAATESLFPLVMFIDDLQWADKSSLELIELTLKDNELLNLLIILAYRDNEEKSTRKVEYLTKIPQIKDKHILIKLQALTYLEVKEYMHLILGPNTQHIDYLARIIYGLTHGNPFYVKEMVDIFIKKDILVYSSQKNQWGIKISYINNISLPTNIEQIITNRINRQNYDCILLLELVACLDGKVEYKTLKRIVDIEDELLNNQLEKLCEATFFVKTIKDVQTEKNLSYGFVHDIIFEIIYKNIESERKSKIHHNIAKKLTENGCNSFAENNRLFIASQLLRVDFELLVNENPTKWIYELYYAGMEVKQTSAIEQALKIFESCIDLLAYCQLDEKHELEMKINLELGECEFICERYEKAKERFETLITQCNAEEDLITIKRKYLNLFVYSGNFEKVIEQGTEILEHLNFKFNQKHLVTELIKARLLFSNKRIESLENAPNIENERILYILETLTKMAPAANHINDKIFALILIKTATISLKHGNSPYAPIGYASYCFILYNIWKDPKKAKKLADITLQLTKDEEDLSIKSLVYFLLGTFVYHLSAPLGTAIKYLEKSIEEGIKAGDFLHSGYSVTSIIDTNYIMGKGLMEIKDYIQLQKENFQRMGHDTVKFVYIVFNCHIHYLEKGILIEDFNQIKDQIHAVNRTRNFTYYTLLLQRLYLEGEIEKAYELLTNITPSINLLKGYIMFVELLFYSILTRLAYHKALTTKEKRKNKKIIRKQMKEIKYWVNIYKDNYYSRLLLIKAEYNALFQENEARERMYYDAIAYAAKQGHLQIEAIGNLLAAKHCNYNIKLSEFFIKEAVCIFKKWGAEHMANVIEDKYSLRNNVVLSDIETSATQANIRIDKNAIYDSINEGLLFLLDSIDNLGEEQGYIYMLNYLAESHNLDYGAVLFNKNDQMFLQYEKSQDDKVIVHQELINIKHLDYMSRRIIRYVARTGEEVILNKEASGGMFSKDLYITGKDELSIVCIPIKYLDVFVGAFYFELKCRQGFNENIIKIVKSIIPTIMSKRTTIKNVNLYNLLNPQKPQSPLTDREMEVLQLVAEGMSNSAISKKLYITPGTVKNHLSNIYSKLEVDSRIKAVVKAKELNLIKI